MKHKLHVASRMFLKDPYVVRVNHPESTIANLDLSKFRQILRTAKLLIRDTWGYSNPVQEQVRTTEQTFTISGGPNTLTFPMPEYEYHSYWVFTNDMDALQFRLTIGDNAMQMHMWPKNVKFTITEYFEDNDDTQK